MKKILNLIVIVFGLTLLSSCASVDADYEEKKRFFPDNFFSDLENCKLAYDAKNGQSMVSMCTGFSTKDGKLNYRSDELLSRYVYGLEKVGRTEEAEKHGINFLNQFKPEDGWENDPYHYYNHQSAAIVYYVLSKIESAKKNPDKEFVAKLDKNWSVHSGAYQQLKKLYDQKQFDVKESINARYQNVYTAPAASNSVMEKNCWCYESGGATQSMQLANDGKSPDSKSYQNVTTYSSGKMVPCYCR